MFKVLKTDGCCIDTDRGTVVIDSLGEDWARKAFLALPELVKACQAAQVALRVTSQDHDYGYELRLLRTALEKAGAQ